MRNRLDRLARAIGDNVSSTWRRKCCREPRLELPGDLPQAKSTQRFAPWGRASAVRFLWTPLEPLKVQFFAAWGADQGWWRLKPPGARLRIGSPSACAITTHLKSQSDVLRHLNQVGGYETRDL